MLTVKAPEALNTGEGPTTVLEPRVTPTTVLLSWMCVILAEMLQLSFSFFQMTSVPPLEGSVTSTKIWRECCPKSTASDYLSYLPSTIQG